jgi:hypothetical protein
MLAARGRQRASGILTWGSSNSLVAGDRYLWTDDSCCCLPKKSPLPIPPQYVTIAEVSDAAGEAFGEEEVGESL